MKIVAAGFRPFEKNTLRGFASLALGSSGLLIAALHDRYPDIFRDPTP
jgi:hypothetical protein